MGTPRFCARAIAAFLLAVVPPAAAGTGLATLEAPELRLVYRDPYQSFLAPWTAQCFENSLGFQKRTFGYTPSSAVTVMLNDYSDFGNASASGVPRNTLLLEIEPLDFAFETVTPNERMNWIMNHELVHVAATDQASAVDRRMRRFFAGKVAPVPEDPESIFYYWLTTPRNAAPSWYHEGIAVFFETWMAGGQGRAQGAYDEMAFRSIVRDGVRLHDPLSLVSSGLTDFQVGVNSYLYGTRFVSYLAWRWSPEEVVRWVSRTDDSTRSYTSQFRRVFGAPLDSVWSEWTAFEKEFQEKNLASLRAYPLTPFRDLSKRALGSISRGFWDPRTRTLYAGFNYPGTVAHLGALSEEDGTIRKLAEIKGPILFSVTSLARDPAEGTLFYTVDNHEMRDIRALDPATGKTRTLLKDARIGDLAFDRADRALWGIRHFNGIATLVRIPFPWAEWKQVRSWPYGEVPYDLDVSPDGSLLSFSVGGIDGLHTLRVYRTADLLAAGASGTSGSPGAGQGEAGAQAGDVDRAEVEDQVGAPGSSAPDPDGSASSGPSAGSTMPAPVVEHSFGTSIPSSFVFSDDGRFLWGSSYYTGVSNVFRLEIATGKLDGMSNAETGFFHPIPREDGSAIVFRYSGQGFVPAAIEPAPLEDLGTITFLGAEIAEKHPIVKSWNLGSPSQVPIDDLVTARGSYRILGGLRLESAYPVLQGYVDRDEADPGVTRDVVAAGWRVNFSDPLRLNRLSVVGAYSPGQDVDANERAHATVEYERYNWWASASANRADFYDLFGPTKTSRKGYELGIGWKRTLVDDWPRSLKVGAEAVQRWNLDTLPDFQNVATNVDQLTTLEADVEYRNVRWSLGAVDDEKGHRWWIQAVADRPGGDLSAPAGGAGGTTDEIDNAFVPRVAAGIDAGLPTGAHSSIWLRTAAGRGFGDRDDQLAQFFFGGFGNNWVDHKEVKRYRDPERFPGLEIDEVGGRTFGKAMLEWNAPPLRFRHLGTTSFYASNARLSVFAAGLSLDPDLDDRRRRIGDFGTQIDVRMWLLSRLQLTLSVGGAVAVEEGFGHRREWMASLKILQ